jgi:hypothetical protein
VTTNAKTYFEMAKERAAELEMDAFADGHSALMLQSQRLANRGGPPGVSTAAQPSLCHRRADRAAAWPCDRSGWRHDKG